MSKSNVWAAIVGRGRDGARELVLRLVRELRAAGLRVGGVKQAHVFERVDGDEVDRTRALLGTEVARNEPHLASLRAIAAST